MSLAVLSEQNSSERSAGRIGGPVEVDLVQIHLETLEQREIDRSEDEI